MDEQVNFEKWIHELTKRDGALAVLSLQRSWGHYGPLADRPAEPVEERLFKALTDALQETSCLGF
jgi:hypothetical protein